MQSVCSGELMRLWKLKDVTNVAITLVHTVMSMTGRWLCQNTWIKGVKLKQSASNFPHVLLKLAELLTVSWQNYMSLALLCICKICTSNRQMLLLHFHSLLPKLDQMRRMSSFSIWQAVRHESVYVNRLIRRKRSDQLNIQMFTGSNLTKLNTPPRYRTCLQLDFWSHV